MRAILVRATRPPAPQRAGQRGQGTSDGTLWLDRKRCPATRQTYRYGTAFLQHP